MDPIEIGWHKYFLNMAQFVSTKSKDESTKVGAVIVAADHSVLSTGYNGLPRGVEYNDYKQGRPQKYKYFEHAERNAIYNAARNGTHLLGSTIYLNWGPAPCTDCTRGIIQSGIQQIVVPNRPFGGRGNHWEIDLGVAKGILDEAGVSVYTVPIDMLGWLE